LFSTLFVRLLGKRRRFLAAGLSVAAIGLYTILVGAEAAVVRAALMGALSLFARQIGRQQDGLNSLGFVAALMATANPNILWDVGFQLSFMATLGLVLYANPLTDAFLRLASRWFSSSTAQRLAGPVGEYVLLTFAAQITTLPVIAYHFNRISLVAFLVNPLILPAQPPVMIVGGLALLAGLAFQPLGQLLAYLAWPFVVFTIRVVEFFAPFPGAMLELGQIALPLILLFYTLLFAWTFARPTLRARLSGLKPGVALLGLGLVVVLVWRSALVVPDGRLHLTMLDVSSGDAFLIQTPTGRYVLVDGGPSTRALSDALGRRLPLERRQLDWLVVAGTSSEQIAALPDILPRFTPDQALWAGAPLGTTAARDLQVALGQAAIPIHIAEAGHVLDLGQGARLEVLGANRSGAVLLLGWGSFQALLPIGLDEDLSQTLLEDPGPMPVNPQQLASSGAADSNPPEWLQAWEQQLFLLSVGTGDRRARPASEVLNAVKGYNLLRTDKNGWIEVTTDGEKMWVTVEKG
jgi:competence protein ComEC